MCACAIGFTMLIRFLHSWQWIECSNLTVVRQRNSFVWQLASAESEIKKTLGASFYLVAFWLLVLAWAPPQGWVREGHHQARQVFRGLRKSHAHSVRAHPGYKGKTWIHDFHMMPHDAWTARSPQWLLHIGGSSLNALFPLKFRTFNRGGGLFKKHPGT